MRLGAKFIRSPAAAAILTVLTLLPLAGCAIPPSGIPTAASIRGLRPSGTVTMTQVFISSSGVGSGSLNVRGRTYPFTLIGSLVGLGAISTMQATGDVYNLHDVSQFSGPGSRAQAASPSPPRRMAKSGSKTATESSSA
jgi:hypothetical protein